MTQQDFEAALDRWGADLRRWPPAAAAQARRFLAEQPLARQALAAAAAVDAYLQGLEQDTAPPHLERQIRARIERHEQQPAGGLAGAPAGVPGATLLDWLTTRLWRPALMALVPILAGFLIGVGSVGPTDGDVAADMAMLAFSDLYAEFDDAQQ
jgi:hypothetical protein